MKLLIYSHDFAPSVGGVESIVGALAAGLARRSEADVEVTVATATPANPEFEADYPYRVVRRPSATALLRLIRQSDVVHVSGPAMLPMALALAARKPLVLEHHGFQAVCPNGQMFYEPAASLCPGHFMVGRHRECWRCNEAAGRWRSLRMWALTFPRRWLCRLAAANIAPTNYLDGVLRLPRTSVIWHGIAGSSATGGASAAGPVAPTRPPSFIYVGRLVSTKGVRVLLDAAAELRRRGLAFRLELIGDGPERQALEARSRALGMADVVHFLGYLPEGAAQQALDGAAAVIMPSLAGEVFGLAAAENMLRGRLVIVSDVGALAEVVGDAGIKVPPGDAPALAAAMEGVLRDPSLSASCGNRARERVLRMFGQERMIDEHARIYRELAAGAGGGS